MAEPARRLSSLPAPPDLPPHVRRGVGGSALPSGSPSGSPQGAAAIAPWSRDALAGRLVEVSSSGDGAPLTMVVALVLDAQRHRETVAWVTPRERVFFPPDVAASGVDLDALAVIRVPDPAQCSRTAARGTGWTADRSGAAARGADRADTAAQAAARVADRANTAAQAAARVADRANTAAQAAARVADRLLRSGAFGLVVLDLGRGDVAMPLQARLVGLAERHDAAVVCLTEKPRTAPSLSSLVSLRIETRRRRRAADGAFDCVAEATKDKRRPPGWTHGEVRHGPPGLR